MFANLISDVLNVMVHMRETNMNMIAMCGIDVHQITYGSQGFPGK